MENYGLSTPTAMDVTSKDGTTMNNIPISGANL
jgi:hypothetical protein